MALAPDRLVKDFQLDFLYFSFTVLTTRGLTTTEQIIGVLDVAILIARLSGIYSDAGSGKA
jgi:hypothetical protein